jgi:hypothetical protein
MTALEPGVRVKVIAHSWTSYRQGLVGPAFGSVWTVNWVGESIHNDIKIGLAEWQNQEECFAPENFVPLAGNEDIAELESALHKGPVDGDRDERVRAIERVE